jgi:ATP-dependent Clp protease ATP-binding subunit ClpC
MGMFERYTEKARRAIFFARYEASAHASSEIDTRCLLLGILREDRDLITRLLPEAAPRTDLLRTEVEALFPPATQRISTSVDLPLTSTAIGALQSAAEEADRRHHQSIEPRHLLWGLFQAGGPEIACLNACGLTVESVIADFE